jgi:hypothetical protein
VSPLSGAGIGVMPTMKMAQTTSLETARRGKASMAATRTKRAARVLPG